MSVINVREAFLNIALAGGKHITVHLLNGAQVSGDLRSFDRCSIVLEPKRRSNSFSSTPFPHCWSAARTSAALKTAKPGPASAKPTKTFFCCHTCAAVCRQPRPIKLVTVIYPGVKQRHGCCPIPLSASDAPVSADMPGRKNVLHRVMRERISPTDKSLASGVRPPRHQGYKARSRQAINGLRCSFACRRSQLKGSLQGQRRHPMLRWTFFMKVTYIR
jgi:hypothetical protein